MNKDLPVGHRDPRTEIVPLRYLQLAAEMVEVQQNINYWNTVAIPVAPSDRIQYEELHQAAVFLPLLPVIVIYLGYGLISAGVALILALPVMSMLHKSVQADIYRARSEWFNRDKGRYSFTQFMCKEFDLRPEDVTLKLVLKMCHDRAIWANAAVAVRQKDAARAEMARAGGEHRRFSDEQSRKAAVRSATGNYALAAAAAEGGLNDVEDGLVNDPQFNPATGLLMLDGVVDVHGNTFGTSNVDDMWQNNNDFNRGGSGGFDNSGGDGWSGEF